MRYVVLLGGLAAALFGYWLFWNHLAGRLQDEAGRWVTERRAAGLTVVHRPFTVEGFPYRLTLRADGLALADPRGDTLWAVESNAKLHIQPWSPNHVVIEAHDAAAVVWQRAGSRPQPARRFFLRASIVAENGRWERIAADAERPAIVLPPQTLTAERLRLAVRRNHGEDKARPDGTFDVSLNGDKIDVPPGAAPGFTAVVDRLGLTARVEGAWNGGALAPALAAWRDDGGVVDVSAFDLVWGKVEAKGDATITLDREMRIEGAGTAEIKGSADIIDALVASGQMKANDAGFAKAGLGLMAKPDKDGRPQLKLPVSAQDGRLYLGPAPIARLAPLPIR